MSGHEMSGTRPGHPKKFKDLMFKSENRICADCNAPNPKWASANIGVFICIKCSEVHRSLGSHISKVLSLTLDEWSEEEIESMIEVGGNSYANAIYEAFLPRDYKKPRPDSSAEDRIRFIRSKYELQEFLKPSLRIVSHAPSTSSFQSGDPTKHTGSDPTKHTGNNLTSNPSRNDTGTSDFIGMLNVKNLKGMNLAIRDMQSSDPYIVLILGQQRAQTTVVNSNLNPVWNEELKLSVPENHGALKLQVYDHDMLTTNDIMGEAEVDIQPLVTAAMAFKDPSSFGDMQIGKWLKSADNALINDSTINIVDGKIKQIILVKLQNVESGELELELEWLPLDQ